MAWMSTGKNKELETFEKLQGLQVLSRQLEFTLVQNH